MSQKQKMNIIARLVDCGWGREQQIRNAVQKVHQILIVQEVLKVHVVRERTMPFILEVLCKGPV